jgi:CHAT domain-containing protein
VPKLLDLGEADPLDLLIVALREELSKPLKGVTVKTAIASARSTLGDVSHRIWHPLFAHVKQADGIIISPDQGLWLLPWAAMLNPDDTFATERFPLQLELSGRELVRVHQRGLLGPAAVFANPAYGTVPASTTNAKGLRIGSAGPLPNTAKEAAAIAPLLAQLTQQPPLVLLTTAATEATFKALNSPSIVVLSTHGFYLDAEGQILKAAALQSGAEVAASPLQDLIPSLVQQNPLLQCGLLLADANRHTAIERLVNDGVLTGAEIVSVDLKNTRLAVLSACETGLGSLDAAGGVIGLRRAFHVAGVHSVVASLWQVPDRETAILMETFFTRLVSVRDVAAALQFAQQSLIDEQRKRNGWAHPFFWAAFNVSGRADLTL